MLSQSQRTTILELHAKGMNKREIAKLLNLSRQSVRKVLRSNSTAVPKIEREEKAEPYRQQILELLHRARAISCESMKSCWPSGAALSYQALTAFCRRHGIGQTPIAPAGQLSLRARRGDAARHLAARSRTSPAGSTRRRPPRPCCATRACCYFQIYPTFQRFDCKVFLTEALRYMGGAPQRVMIDNTHVVVLRGSGKRDGSRARDGGLRRAFRLPLRGARDRRCQPLGACGAAVPLYREQLSGRANLRELGGSEPARRASGAIASTRLTRNIIRAVPRELFAVERLHLKPLPAWIPEVYRLHQRMVDIEGYVALHSNRYSVPVGLHRPPRGSARNAATRSRSNSTPAASSRTRALRHCRAARDAGRTPAAAWRGSQARRSSSGRTSHPQRRAGARGLCGGPEAARAAR